MSDSIAKGSFDSFTQGQSAETRAFFKKVFRRADLAMALYRSRESARESMRQLELAGADLTRLPVHQFAEGDRVIAKPEPFAHCPEICIGGPGKVTRITPAGGGDFWIWVLLDGPDKDHPYFAKSLRKEPTI